MDITLRDVWDEQRRTSGQLAAIATQVATLTTRVDLQLAAGQLRMADHEARLRTLERWRWQMAGAIMLLNVVVAVIAELILRSVR